MNFFAGLGNFASGASRGIDDAQKIKGAYDKGKLQKAYKDGIKGAEASRQSEIDAGVKPTYEGGINTGYKGTGGKVYGDEASARAASEKAAPDVMEYFMKDAAPKIGQMYLEQGSPEKAAAWGTWVDGQNGKKAIGQWSDAYKSLMTGDIEAGAEKFGQFYTDQIDDGVDYRGQTPVKNEAGDITGFKMKLFDRDTNKMHDIEMSKDKMIELGNAFNPQALFERVTAQGDKASALAAEVAMGDRESNRDLKGKIELEGVKSGYRQEESRTDAQLEQTYGTNTVRGKFDANVDILSQSGFSDEEIKEFTPGILGISTTRAAMSDRDLRSKIVDRLTDGYMLASKFNALSSEEQEAKINAMVRLIDKIQPN